MSVGRPERAISSCSKQKEHATLPGVLSDHTRPSGLPASMAQNNSRRVWRGGARRAETAEIAAARSTPRPHPPRAAKKKPPISATWSTAAAWVSSIRVYANQDGFCHQQEE